MKHLSAKRLLQQYRAIRDPNSFAGSFLGVTLVVIVYCGQCASTEAK